MTKTDLTVERSITAERLREILDYSPDTGIFIWKIKTTNSIHVGDIAGHRSYDGYSRIKTDKFLYLSHRLAWLYIYGDWPKKYLDHINGLRHDNRLVNLRECTNSENMQNSGTRKDNTTGITGVSFDATNNKWRVQIKVNKKSISIGRFDTLPDAIEKRQQAKQKYHTFCPINREEFDASDV